APRLRAHAASLSLVEPTPAPVRLLDHPHDVVAARDVRADRDLVELTGHLLHAGIEIGQHEPGAVGREPVRAGGADTARRAGDEHCPSVELSHLPHLPKGRIYEVLDHIPAGPE